MAAIQTDREMTLRIMRDLATLAPLDLQRIRVEVEHGVAFLRGEVGTEAQREVAVFIAQHVAGVYDVVDLLGVDRPTHLREQTLVALAEDHLQKSAIAAPRRTGRSAGAKLADADRQIADSVRADLIEHARLNPNNLGIQVRSGVVSLSGEVRSDDERARAEEVAWWTAGVRRVLNRLKIVFS